MPVFLLAYVAVTLWVSKGRIAEFWSGCLPEFGHTTNQILLLNVRYLLRCTTDLFAGWMQPVYRSRSYLESMGIFLSALLVIANLWCPSVFTESGIG